MTSIFSDLLHKDVECYVDDLVVKTVRKSDHIQVLDRVFERLRKHHLKMNPFKCAFGVSSGKFLGFIVRYRGIEIDPQKIKAILDMPPPQNPRELQSLQGKLAYIRRFISNLAGRVHPFSRLRVPFIWDESCQRAFDSIKRYLTKPPVLSSPIKGKPLILYIAALPASLGALLAQHNEEGKEVALYYLSRTLVGSEHNYSAIEKLCLALVFAVKKLRHYMLSHEIRPIARADPIKYILNRPVLQGRLGKWAVMLAEHDIVYIPQRAVKGQALADFLAAHPVPDDSPLITELPDEEVLLVDEGSSYWELYFDGASRVTAVSPAGVIKRKAGAGVVFRTPANGRIYHSYSLLKDNCSNNEAEYEALIIGLALALDMGMTHLHIFGDSQLVIRQLQGIYEVRKPELVPYYLKAKHLMEQFVSADIDHIRRPENAQADALAKLASALTLPFGDSVNIRVEQRLVLPPVLDFISDRVEAQHVTSEQIETG